MSVLFAAFLGIIQGLTEFLPVSSSGHLSIFQNFFGMQDYQTSHMMFDVILHLGTLIAVIIVYRSDVWDIIKELLAVVRDIFCKNKRAQAKRSIPTRRLILMVIVATLPLFAVVPLQKYVEQLYYKTVFVGIALIITGLILYISDKVISGKKNERNATMLDALLVGCMQAFATVPGISRSGTTITTGLLRGFDRKFAVKFSFLMSIPAVLGANILTVADVIKEGGFNMADVPAYIIGVVVSAVAAYFAIGVVKMLTDKGKFGKFSYYCWAVGAAVIIASIIL